MPPRNVVPKPIQKPHPPVWVACHGVRPSTWPVPADRRAELCLNPEEARLWSPTTTMRSRRQDPIASPPTPIWPSYRASCATRTRRRRGARPSKGSTSSYSLNYHFITGTYLPGKTSIWDDYKKSSADEAAKKAQEEMLAAKDRFGRPVSRRVGGVPDGVHRVRRTGPLQPPGDGAVASTRSSSRCRPATTSTSTSSSR